MKLLENNRFEALSSALSVRTDLCQILCRLESYSCKLAGPDKRLFKQMNAEPGTSPNDLQALSPPQSGFFQPYPSSYSRSQSGEDESPLCDTISRKTLFYLIATLNSAFQPDYDFSDATSSDFYKEPSLKWVMNNVDTNLMPVAGRAYRAVRDELWATVDQEISLKDCDIYSYCPDMPSDPFGDAGCIWSFNYYLYNKKMKRIVFFTCRGVSTHYLTEDSGLGEDVNMQDDDY